MKINLKLDLSHLPEGHTGHLMPTEEVVNTFLDISKKSKIKNILEFGFNTGWSSYIMLELFKKAKITSIEIYKFSEALKGVSIIKNTFQSRFEIIWEDSQILYKKILENIIRLPFNNYDTAFIDGGHYPEIVDNDIKLSKLVGIKNFILDDGECPNILPAIYKHNDLKLINKYPYFPLRKINNRYFLKKNKGWKVGLHHYQILT
jgi:hypothetical protein